MQIKNISHLTSQKENLETWCYEVGDRFESYSRNAVNEFIYWHEKLKIKNKIVADLGCGDGAASNYFLDQGFQVYGVDINVEKLRRVEAGVNVFRSDVHDFILGYPQIDFNIFTHHSLEHMVEAEDIITRIGSRIRPGKLYYAVVPAEDYIHSVHHVVFEAPEELLPPGLTPLLMDKRDRFGEKEFICIAWKEPKSE